MEDQQIVERATSNHNLLIRIMVNKLRNEGYAYVAADHISEPIDKPFPIEGALPDIHATRKGCTLYIEVETYSSLIGKVNAGNWNIFNKEALRAGTEFWIVVSKEDADLAERTHQALGLTMAKVYSVDLYGRVEFRKLAKKPYVKKALAKRFEGKTDLDEIGAYIQELPEGEERSKRQDDFASVLARGGETERPRHPMPIDALWEPKGYRIKVKKSEFIPFPAGKDFSVATQIRHRSINLWFWLSVIVSVIAIGLLIYCIVQLALSTYTWATLAEGLGVIPLIFAHYPFYNRYREELSILEERVTRIEDSIAPVNEGTS